MDDNLKWLWIAFGFGFAILFFYLFWISRREFELRRRIAALQALLKDQE